MSKIAKPPRNLIALFVLAGFGGIAYLGIGVWLILGPKQNLTTSGVEMQPWFLLVSGLLCLILGMLYFWGISESLKRGRYVPLVAQVICIINIAFGFFRLPGGFITILINLTALILLFTPSVTAWFNPKI